MKVNFNRQALAEALALLTSIIPSRTPKPVLRCVRITAGEKDAHICATDLEVGIDYTIDQVQIDEPGEVVIEADKLSAIVRESTEDVLTLETVENLCRITGLDSKFDIYSYDPSQYPAVPSFEGEPEIQIALDKLKNGIEQCLFAAARESSRYAINGVLWQADGKKLLMVATDGRRLARCKVSLAKAAGENIQKRNIIVPAKAMALLDKVAVHEKETVWARLVNNQIVIKYANVVISSNLIEGNFPNYEDIIPSNYQKKLTLSTDNVLSAVRRAALLASQESKGIKLSITKNKVTFSGRAPEAGTAEVNMEVEYSGDAIDIGFNPQYLIDALRVMQTPEFTLELEQSDRPGLIKSSSDFLYVIMPINLA